MNRLVIRIFLWLWLAMTLIGAIGVALTLGTDPRKAELLRHQERLQRQGEELVAVYSSGGNPALRSRLQELEREHHRRSLLFHPEAGALGEGHLPRRLQALALQALETGQPEVQPGKRGLWAASPLPGNYVALSELRPQGPLGQLLNPYRLAPRLLATFLVTGLVALLLARSLSAPLTTLRQATQRFAAGDLSTRVRQKIRGEDEIGALAADFDRMAERIEALVEDRQRLLRDISHELRSPLARLSIALELARLKAGAAATPPLDRIELEAQRLNELIGELLSLARTDTPEPQAAEVQLDLLLAEVAADADYEARGRQCRVELGRCEALTLQGQGELLRRALENVLRNAIRHTAPATAISLSLQRVSSAQGAQALIRVRDRGPGVAEELLEQLFLPFFRIEEARDRQSGGTGLGLAITQRAIQLHGGQVQACNHPQGGLVVELLLPLNPPAPAPP